MNQAELNLWLKSNDLRRMQSHERVAARLFLYTEGVITDGEFIRDFLSEILDGKLTTIKRIDCLPIEFHDRILKSLTHLENNDYVDTYPYQRESIEDRRAKAQRFRKQYERVFAELRTSFRTEGAG